MSYRGGEDLWPLRGKRRIVRRSRSRGDPPVARRRLTEFRVGVLVSESFAASERSSAVSREDGRHEC
jgi:hypothetical protein